MQLGMKTYKFAYGNEDLRNIYAMNRLKSEYRWPATPAFQEPHPCKCNISKSTQTRFRRHTGTLSILKAGSG
jgi:hypothetical protein